MFRPFLLYQTLSCLVLLLVSIDVRILAARQKDKAATVPNTEQKTAGRMQPSESLRALQLPEGFQATLFAAEPDVQQPIAATTDARGRLWVCENYTYSDSKVNFDLSLNDRVLIFEDVDGDGRFDSRKVFWNRGKRLTGIAIGFDGVYLTCAPHLLFLPDRNRDDIPDGPPEVLLDGWDKSAVRHNIVNGLMWGPDGWLYGRHGILATSFVGRPGDTLSQRQAINCGVWRFHPRKRKFEVVAHGTTNPWGMDYNNDGDLFMINTVIGHLWQVMPGARYDRMYGSHFNPYTYQTMEQSADHYHWNRAGGEAWHDTKKIGVTPETDRSGGGHAHCGMLYYGDDQWPEKYRDSILTCNLLGHRINRDLLVPRGNGFVGRHRPDFARTSDTWFRGIELVRSHDQGFYLLDWQDTGECHENDGVHRTSGRIYKVNFGKGKTGAPDLGQLSEEQLVQKLVGDRWQFEQASMELRTRMARNERTEQRVVDLVKQHQSPDHANLSLFRTQLSSDCGSEMLYNRQGPLAGLPGSSRPTEVRERACREALISIGNEQALRGTVIPEEPLVDLASQFDSPRVRQRIASLLFRMEESARFPVAGALAAHEKDEQDQNQSRLIWYAIEPGVVRFPARAARLARESQLLLLTELITRRLSEELDRADIAAEVLGILRSARGERLSRALRGMASALKGRRRVSPPATWGEFAKQSLDREQRQLVKQISVVFGDGQTFDELRRLADDRSGDSRVRGRALLTLAENGTDDLAGLLNRHFGDKEVRRYVIEAYAYCDHPTVGERIIGQFPRLKPAEQRAAINTLTKRPHWAQLLLEAVEKEKVERSLLTAWHARQIVNLGDRQLTARLETIWGPIRTSPADKSRQMEAMKKRVSAAEVTPEALALGERVFQKSCANCHVLFGKGGRIGPDLTGGNRRDLGYLLENIMDPGSSVADSFRSSVVNLVDGRTITGVILKQTPQVLEIQSAEKKLLVDRRDVEQVRQTANSLMPEGLLDPLSPAEQQGLFLYLMSR